VGATMRHNDAGLAIPDFPLAFGRLVPHVWNMGVAIHFAHRVGGVVVALAIVALAGHVLYHHGRRRELTRPALTLVVLVSMQITLGAFVIWSGRDAVINTAHVVNGALVLATSLLLTLRTFRGADQRLVQPIHGGATHGFPGLANSGAKP
jgi:heme a synthase